MSKILLVEDQQNILNALHSLLKKRKQYFYCGVNRS